MLREKMMERGAADRPGWRWRGLEVSRVKALSDVVFGFAITLLVISPEVPRTSGDLPAATRGMPAFAACARECLLNVAIGVASMIAAYTVASSPRAGGGIGPLARGAAMWGHGIWSMAWRRRIGVSG